MSNNQKAMSQASQSVKLPGSTMIGRNQGFGEQSCSQFNSILIKHQEQEEEWKRKQKVMYRYMRKLLWGDDPNKYNYCNSTLFGSGPIFVKTSQEIEGHDDVVHDNIAHAKGGINDSKEEQVAEKLLPQEPKERNFQVKWGSREYGFVFMQTMRLIYVITITLLFWGFNFIYLRIGFFQFNFWALLFSHLAFLFLLMGTGKQVVFQNRLINREIQDEKEKRPKLWLYGQFFYTLALPITITSNIIYFMDYEYLRQTRLKRFIPPHNRNVQHDINELLKIFYYRIERNHKPSVSLSDNGNTGEDWRTDFVLLAHVIPLGCMGFDMVLNRIRMRFQHVVFLLFFMGLYFLLAMHVKSTLNYDIGIYFENLNFGCSQNYHYEYDSYFRTDQYKAFPPSNVINNTLKEGVCFKQSKNSHELELACNTITNFYCVDGIDLGSYLDKKVSKSLTKDYVRALKDQVDYLEANGMYEWTPWNNAYFLMTFMLVCITVVFCLCYFIHLIKLAGSEPFHYDEVADSTIECFEGQREEHRQRQHRKEKEE